MASHTQNLSKAIQGLWQDRSNDMDVLPVALQFSPINPMLGNGEYQIMSNDLRRDERDPRQGAVLSDNADYALGEFGYSTVSIQTERHSSLLYKLPQSVIDALEGENSVLRVADDAMKACSNQILDGYTAKWVAAADAGLAAAAGGALDLSTQSTDLVSYFDALIEEIEKESGKRPTHIVMGSRAFRAFRNMDQVQGSTALGETGGRRTGYAPMSAVASFFRAAFGLEILVETRTKIDSSGSADYTLDTQLFIGCAGDPRSSCITTFAKDSGLITFDTRDLVLPMPEGVGVAANAFYKVEVTDAAAGRKVAVTL